MRVRGNKASHGAMVIEVLADNSFGQVGGKKRGGGGRGGGGGGGGGGGSNVLVPHPQALNIMVIHDEENKQSKLLTS